MVRRNIVEAFGCPDWPVAIAEDVITILSAVLSMHVVTS
jgi:uncharacterized membrane protein